MHAEPLGNCRSSSIVHVSSASPSRTPGSTYAIDSVGRSIGDSASGSSSATSVPVDGSSKARGFGMYAGARRSFDVPEEHFAR